MEKTKQPLYIPATINETYIKNLTSQIGIKLQPTPVSNELSADITAFTLFCAFETFMRDLLRRSHAYKWTNNSSSKDSAPDEITCADIQGAIKSNAEFTFLDDIFLDVEQPQS